MVSQAGAGVEEGRCYGAAPKICAPAPHWLALTSAHLCTLASQSMKDLDVMCTVKEESERMPLWFPLRFSA